MPLVEHRRALAGDLLKVLDYEKGEQVRDWYRRHGISTANFEPELVPYYLLLVGPPTWIPFEFQYLLGIEYAVGRLAFDAASDYARYARSVVEYETATAVNNAKEIVYWGTRHPADPATNLRLPPTSSSPWPTASTSPGAAPSLKASRSTSTSTTGRIALQFGRGDQGQPSWRRSRPEVAAASCCSPPRTGSGPRRGQRTSTSSREPCCVRTGPGSAPCGPTATLAASDLSDDATVGGMIAFIFACFGQAGTPR